MIDRQHTPSPWSQTMSRIHSSPVNNDTESVVIRYICHMNASIDVKMLY